MRRIATGLLAIALVAFYLACSADAPAPTAGGGANGGPRTSPTASALQVRLFTSNANPVAGNCTLIQAIVSLNGSNVPDGTGVAFSTDFGFFSQNGNTLVSVTTQGGAATTALCSSGAGLANVRATATVGGQTGTATLPISFQPAVSAGPFFSSCSPSFAPNTGGSTLTLNGGRFFGSPSTTRVTFTAAGVTREALVTAVTANTITVTTPAFPEAQSPSVPVTITVSLGTNTASPVVLTIPNCFAFGTAGSSTPKITAVLPASGSKDGNTRVSIIGSGFSAPLQVFLQAGTVQVEAQVVSITFNQILILTPAAFNFGSPIPINTPIDIIVREATSGTSDTLVGGYRYVLPLQVTGFSPLQMRSDQITPVTIFGHGFQSPVIVTIGSTQASVLSVSDTEIEVLPIAPTACASVSGGITVTEINTGETVTAPGTFTLNVVAATISGINPTHGTAGTTLTITGTNLPLSPGVAEVRFGTTIATVTGVSSDGTSLTVIVPAGTNTTVPPCPGGSAPGTPVPTGESAAVSVRSRATGCSTAGPSFAYEIACGVADLTVSKVGSPNPVATTTNLTYTVNISNAGGITAAGVVMTDPLPAGVTFVSCTPTQGTCGFSAGTVTATLGSLPAGGGAIVTMTVNVTAPATTVLSNTASVTTTTVETTVSNNTSTTTTTVGP
jgi:uncharacterized repeat protein (TIGR01451 family)